MGNSCATRGTPAGQSQTLAQESLDEVQHWKQVEGESEKFSQECLSRARRWEDEAGDWQKLARRCKELVQEMVDAELGRQVGWTQQTSRLTCDLLSLSCSKTHASEYDFDKGLWADRCGPGLTGEVSFVLERVSTLSDWFRSV